MVLRQLLRSREPRGVMVLVLTLIIKQEEAMAGYCDRCNNTGWIDCHCGGDLCVCENGGEKPCPVCDGDPNFFCDEIEEGYDAGEWNNVPPQEPKR